MESKSGRHKEKNTFKFLPFSERIANIDIDIFHHVAHEYETQLEEDECFFHQAVVKWDVLNLTEGYTKFRKEIRADGIVTLPQLVHQKDKVIEILLKHLEIKNSLFLQPLLELTVALAKDLRKEFYPYYPKFIEVIIELLNTKDTDQLEWTFSCLAYLFKFLWRPLIKDVRTVFKNLLPLLSDSKPAYINNFAAESFAFVVRKVRDKEAFLRLLLKETSESEDEVVGCGKLLFEVLHGVNGHFHSCAESLFPFLVESLGNQTLSKQTLFPILETIVSDIVTQIAPQESALFWNTCIETLNKFCESWKETQVEQDQECLEQLLKLIGQAVEYKQGKFLQKPAPLVQEILKLLSITESSPALLLLVVQLSISLMLSKHIKLAQEQASALTRKILTIPNQKVLLYFVEHSSSYPGFEALILPAFLKHCFTCNLDQDSLLALTKVILKKSPLCEQGIDLDNWKKYILDFGSSQSNSSIEKMLFNHISSENFSSDHRCMEMYLCALICFPHIKFEDNNTNLQEALIKNIALLCPLISEGFSSTNTDSTRKLLFFLLNTMECLVHVSDCEILAQHFEEIINCILPLCDNYLLHCCLKILDLYLSACKNTQVICLNTLKKLDDVLKVNFSSPYHEMRLLTAHIYSLFENLNDLQSSNKDTEWKIFSLCYEIESITPLVHTYREQIIRLEKFGFDKEQIELCKNTEFNTIPLRYLCGVLHMNFKLLRDPTINIIISQGEGLDTEVFWPIFIEELRNATELVRNPREIKWGCLGSSYSFLEDCYQHVNEIRAKVDYFDYRMMLWKVLEGIPEIAEMKTRDVSGLFLDFIQNEYLKSNSDVAFTWNIKKYSTDETLEVEDADESVKMEVEDMESQEKLDLKKELLKPVANHGGKLNAQCLIQQLKVLSKIKSPKSMYREPELYDLYFEFLSHKHHEIQRLALDCLLTYKPKYLLPYKENLIKLIDEQNFKNELAIFRVDEESGVVHAEHREQLLPIVMKLVFSKMFAKTGMRTRGKSTGQFRRTLILRFLAGCKETELLSFLDMAFGFYKRFMKDDPEFMVKEIAASVDLENFIPLKRLNSTLNLLTVMLKQFGGLMGNDMLSFFIKVVFIIGAHMKGAFVSIPNIHVGYLAALRTIRTSCIKLVEEFFGRFDNYPWTSKDINAIFDVFVWPYLDKLPVEGIHSPTSLLKLFVQWGSNPKYFPLLVKYNEDSSAYVLPKIMQLMLQRKTNITVYNAILEMLEKMLHLEENPEEENQKLEVENVRPIEEEILLQLKVNDKLNYGSCILLPHVPDILNRIRWKLESKLKNLNQRELFILSRISELVWDAEISDSVLTLLLPIALKKSNAGEEVVLKYLSSVKNLLQNVEKPQRHIRSVLPFFGTVTYASSRKVLIEIIEVIAKKDYDKFATLANVLNNLNAFDLKWVDQPHFEKRLNGFREIKQLVNDDILSIDLGIGVIYNCYFTLSNEADLSLKESATDCWKIVSSYLISKFTNGTDRDFILNDTLFSLIRRGMRSKNEEFRNQCVLLLGHLGRKNSNAHIVLQDLHKLTDEVDVEVDFFENITHLQLHRRARALLKFSTIFSNQTANSRTLTQFILPIVSNYLCNDTYLHKNSLIDAVIRATSTISRLLPWHQYEGLLKYYLDKLKHKVEYQKQLVRVVVAILDSFHFNLSKAYISENQPEKLPEEKIEENESQIKDSEEDTEENDDLELEDELQLEEPNNEDEEKEDASGNEEKEENSTVVDETNFNYILLCKSTATRVIRSIQFVLLPQLNRVLAEMTQYESSHKVNRKRTGAEREEEDLLRVPISLAVVKLLQQLPKQILEKNLPGVLMKLCTFLKSQLESVRRTARETLQKIIATLGAKYLGVLLEVMSTLLSKGYQVHVLVYTTHSILVTLKEKFEVGDVDKVLLTVLNLCKVDLFGSVGEEKEVQKIVRKVSEAKSTKSYDTLQILAQFITHRCLVDLIIPIKDVLSASRSHKIVFKAQEALRNVAIGLVENLFIPIDLLLQFTHGVCSEKIVELLPKREKKSVSVEAKSAIQKSDCFIIQPEPVGRSGFRNTGLKASNSTNAHVLVEFGLRICHHLFKKEKLKEEQFVPYIDPFIVILKDCLVSKNVKLSTLTLNCLSWVMKYNLPSLNENVKEISELIFYILHKYGAAGLSKGDNFDLVVAAFKAMAVLVRDVKCFKVSDQNLKVLLLYVEQDLHDHDRQATAFSLLRAIIGRKLMTKEIHDVMEKVSEMSITSELPHVRMQCRLVLHQFLMDYRLGKKLKKYVAFYLSQLSYSMQFGRDSALDMIQTLISSFPVEILKEHSEMFMITLGARLVNDDVPECRKKCAKCLSSMLSKLSRSDRDVLFKNVFLWLQDSQITHRRLAAQICGIFVTVEKSVFEARLDELLPMIFDQFLIGNGTKPGRFVLLKFTETEETDSCEARVQDHHLFQVLQLLLKLCAHCPGFLHRIQDIEMLANHVQTLLAYPHDWVRLGSAQFLGFVLSTLNVDDLADLLISNTDREKGYLHTDPVNQIKSLTLDLCAQLQPGIKSNFAEQVVKNLVFLARVLEKVPLSTVNINLLWLAKRMRKIVNTEVVENPTDIVLRTEVFKWIAGVGTALEVEKIKEILPHLLGPLVREMITTEVSNAPLRQLSKEVGNVLKRRVGPEEYSEALSKQQQKLSVRRAERRRDRNELAVTDPELYAKRKIKQHEKKKVAKKRKIDQNKGVTRTFKKKKVVDLDNSEIM